MVDTSLFSSVDVVNAKNKVRRKTKRETTEIYEPKEATKFHPAYASG